VGSELFFAQGFVIPFHFVKRIARDYTERLELPVALRATETFKILAPHPFQGALHCFIIQFRPACKTEQILRCMTAIVALKEHRITPAL
jgi:hypothetical protein